jgi:hypothetical protein
MTAGADKVEAGRHLVEAAAAQGLTARLLGGVGIALSCPSASEPPLAREYGDLDLITNRRAARALAQLLEDEGYIPDREFNAAQGRSRMLFQEPEGPGHVDVFIETFVMCHTLELGNRLELEPLTLSVSDLLLTKMQIATVNHKDIVDATAILLDHDLGGDAGKIDLAYLTKLLASDWGWWRTVTENLERMGRLLPSIGLSDADEAAVAARLEALEDEIEGRSKGVKWRARARIGERLPWRDEPEEID